jgi:GTP-binding protein
VHITARFVTSAAGPEGFPRERLPEVALVGRSNVGKSSLINALARQRVARTSAAPGKTRLANFYRVQRGTAAPGYLVDLPGYGYARAPRQTQGGLSRAEGRRQSADAFARLTEAYFARDGARGVLLLVDARHPGLESDREAWAWLAAGPCPACVVATKIDKLSRSERARHLRQLEDAFTDTVVPVSALTGEGLDRLWQTIARLPTTPNTTATAAAAALPPRPPTPEARRPRRP